jgi:hypothetical protein
MPYWTKSIYSSRICPIDRVYRTKYQFPFENRQIVVALLDKTPEQRKTYDLHTHFRPLAYTLDYV